MLYRRSIAAVLGGFGEEDGISNDRPTDSHLLQ